LKESEKLGLTEAKSTALNYSLKHFSSILKQKDGIYALGLPLFYEVVCYVQHNKKNNKKHSVEFNIMDILSDLREELIEQFRVIYKQKFRADVIFKINSERILCHKALLLGQSNVLRSLFQNKDPNVEIVLPKRYSDISVRSFKAMIKFIYYGDKRNIDLIAAHELKDFVKEYQLLKVCEVVEDILREGLDEDIVIPLYNVILKEKDNGNIAMRLEGKTVDYIMRNFQSIDLGDLYQDSYKDCSLSLLDIMQNQIKKENWKPLVVEDQPIKIDLKVKRLKGPALSDTHLSDKVIKSFSDGMIDSIHAIRPSRPIIVSNPNENKKHRKGKKHKRNNLIDRDLSYPVAKNKNKFIEFGLMESSKEHEPNKKNTHNNITKKQEDIKSIPDDNIPTKTVDVEIEIGEKILSNDNARKSIHQLDFPEYEDKLQEPTLPQLTEVTDENQTEKKLIMKKILNKIWNQYNPISKRMNYYQMIVLIVI